MTKNKTSDELKTLLKENSIDTLYNKVMQGYSGGVMDIATDVMKDGNYRVLYAPGYEEIGIADVVAQCK